MTSFQRLVDRVQVVHGPRGVGKTSLLHALRQRARELGAVTVWVPAGQEVLSKRIIDGICDATADWKKAGRRLRATLNAVDIKFTAGIPGLAQAELTRPARAARATEGGPAYVAAVLTETARAALSEGHRGVLVLIDEIQTSGPTELETLVSGWQILQADITLPLALFTAGLPDSRRALTQAATSAERFSYLPISNLSPTAAGAAITQPAIACGVNWTPEAVYRAVQIADGYPHLVQLLADTTWSVAGNPDRGTIITINHVDTAYQHVSREMNALLAERWAQTPHEGQRFLAAQATFGDRPVRQDDLARLLGLDSAEFGVAKEALVHASLITPNQEGDLEFTVPGMTAYIQTHHRDLISGPEQIWAACTPSEQAYLHAVAHSIGPAGTASTTDIARALNRTVQQLSPVRQRLLKAGILCTPAWGSLAFTHPDMTRFVRSFTTPSTPA